jgi:formate hydrogenlyase subunit 3/multisubunit Na+/H+ antiporter MnhD subunit
MINLVLLFPLIACLIIYIFKKDFLNTCLLNLYAILHLSVSIFAILGKDFLPTWQSCSFFALNQRNVLFLAIMSIVFLAVAIYNSGYLKGESDSPQKLRHYTYMLLF